MEHVVIFIGYCVSYISKLFQLGSGATWPGEIALRIDPHILSSLSKKISKGIIIVAGTNGKTTTSLMIKKMLEDKGYAVLHNASGANLLNGIVSAFFCDTRNSFDYAVFEVDENALPSILIHLRTMNHELRTVIVLLNLFRDQLDRYGEVDTIAEKWTHSFQKFDANVQVIINADDPHLSLIGRTIKDKGNIAYFGLGDTKYYLPAMQHATDTLYCPVCGARLYFEGVYFSHLGTWSCKKCTFSHPDMDVTAKDVSSPLEGVYNIYNTLAATTLGKSLGLDERHIKKSIAGFHPAFGRMEEVAYKGKHIRILLSKNPTGCNESIRTVLGSKQKGPMMILLNDRIPDGTDVSWIWDVDFEQLDGFAYPIVVSGDRYLDMGVRLKYGCHKNSIFNFQFSGKSQNSNIKQQLFYITPSLDDAVEKFIGEIKDKQIGWILATYSAMLDVRKILTGRKIL